MGKLGRAVLKLYNKENAEAMAELSPVPRQLGALGLFKGVEAVAKSLTKMDGWQKSTRCYTHQMLPSQFNVMSHPSHLYHRSAAIAWSIIMALSLHILFAPDYAVTDLVGCQSLNPD